MYNESNNLSKVTCIKCQSGYFLTKNACIKGNVSNCFYYQISVNVCMKCEDGYVLIDSVYFNGSFNYCFPIPSSF